MPKGDIIIRFKKNNRKVNILVPVKDSLHASRLSDRINALPYLKVYEREYIIKNSYAFIKCHTILGEFDYETLHNDLDLMSDLIIQPNEPIKK